MGKEAGVFLSSVSFDAVMECLPFHLNKERLLRGPALEGRHQEVGVMAGRERAMELTFWGDPEVRLRWREERGGGARRG